MQWPLTEQHQSKTILDCVPEIHDSDQIEQFGGLWGYQHTYNKSGFLNDSNFYVISSEIKGQERIYIVDMATSKLRSLVHANETYENGCGPRIGHYELLARRKDTLIVKYSQVNQAPEIFSYKFLKTDVELD